MRTRPGSPTDVRSMAALAAGQQATGSGHIGYVGSDARSIASDIAAVERWTERSAVAVEGGTIVGWMLGEYDAALDRAWWWGPFVDDAVAWLPTADAIYDSARSRFEPREEELAPDDRNRRVAAFGASRGFLAEEASAVLSRAGHGFGEVAGVLPLDAARRGQVAALHDTLFPGTHTPGGTLVEADSVRLVAVKSDVVVGYVAAEMQSDGSGYIDYLGVAPAARGAGAGRRLVMAAISDLADLGATSMHLTVRESNLPARSLYASLGFTTDRLIRPFRKGFTLP